MAIKNLRRYADTLKANKTPYQGLWDEVGELMGDKLSDRLNGYFDTGKDESADETTYDPAIRRIRNTISDYFFGLLFPLEKPFNLIHPREVGLYKSWYDSVSTAIINYLQSPESGFYENAPVAFNDWVTNGNAALGAFETGEKESPYIVKSYGVDCISWAEGKNGNPNYFAYHDMYTAGDLVETFGYENVPTEVMVAYDEGKDNLFEVVLCIVPNLAYKKGTSGKNGKAYLGHWFVGDETEPVLVEYYDEKPIAAMRMIKTRGHLYAKSEISQNVGTLKVINASIFTAILNMKNTALPPMGVYSNSILNNGEIDNTAGGITIFDSDVMLNGATPIFPINEQGDVSPLFNVLTTYLKDEIAKLNRMDLIVDIESRTNMTATEFLRRLAMKGDALGGALIRTLNQLSAFFERIINISVRSGLVDMDEAPDEIKEMHKKGQKWYRLGFNSSVQSLLDSTKQSDLLNAINIIGAATSFDQSIVADLDFYATLKEQFGNTLVGSALTATVAEHKEGKQAMLAQQQQLAQSEIEGNMAKAQKDLASSNNAYERSV